MAERALRGSRLGAQSYETDLGVEMAPRQSVTYDCPRTTASPSRSPSRPTCPRSGSAPSAVPRRCASTAPARAEGRQAGPHPLGHAARAPQRQGARGAARRAAGAAPRRHPRGRSTGGRQPAQERLTPARAPHDHVRVATASPVARPGRSSSGALPSDRRLVVDTSPGTTRSPVGRPTRSAAGPAARRGPAAARAADRDRRPARRRSRRAPAGQRPGERQDEEEAERRR